MSNYDANPFSDPFADQSVTNATAPPADLEDYNPFANQNQPKSQPAVMDPTGAPPAYSPTPATTAEPRAAPQQQAVPGHEELLRRQEELERKAEELERKEQQLNAGNFDARANNWPPIPKWCPIGPCFFQDFAMEIPLEFQKTMKTIYYMWMFYVSIMFLNVFSCMAVFIVAMASGDKNSSLYSTAGVSFGLSILWFCINSPCSICWYRPAYNAFKSDSSFYFFSFFFVMFCQSVVSIVQAIGIQGSGYTGWIVAVQTTGTGNVGLAVMAFLQSVLFTINATANIIFLKKVHTIYRTTGASFEKAQQEFATGVMKNPGVQRAAADATTAAVQSSLNR